MIIPSQYMPPVFFRNGHANTLYAALLRRVDGISYERERISTSDNDFLDLDWSKVGGKNLLIALHGLEGSSYRPYIQGLLKYFNNRGWDGMGMNFRGCSGEINRQLRTYHMGEIEDLSQVLEHVLSKYSYARIVIAGFSLGGNVILKFLAKNESALPKEIKAGITFSVPCDLPKANQEINRRENFLYRNRFLYSLNRKYLEKRQFFPDLPPLQRPMRNFSEFDDLFTAPVHGFGSAEEYWRAASSIDDLERIGVPVYMLSARDDSFLSKECYPFRQAKTNDQLYLEVSPYGGHVGFVDWNEENAYYSEQRAWSFITEVI